MYVPKTVLFKTVLFTSHSKDDSARDYSALSLRQDCRFLSHPAVNPFMSLKRDVAVTNLKYIINRSPPLSAPPARWHCGTHLCLCPQP